MDDNDSEFCPCGSGKQYELCCKKEFDHKNQAKERLQQALSSPDKSKELMDLLEQAKSKK